MIQRPSVTRFPYLDYLRALAIILVLWDHLFNIWPLQHGVTLPHDKLLQFIKQPLGIIQDFGWMGVCLFFFISGFLIAHVASTSSINTFLIKRLFRIYPLYIFILLLSLLTENLNPKLFLRYFLESLLFLNYWQTPQHIHIGTAWTLAIEVLFYLLIIATMRMRKHPVLMVSVQACIVMVILINARTFGAAFFLFASSVAYIPYLIVGEYIYLIQSRSILPGMGGYTIPVVLYSILIYSIYTIHTIFLPTSNSYVINAIYSLVIFLALSYYSDFFRHNKFVFFLSTLSYSLYLAHAYIGDRLFMIFLPYLGVYASIFSSLIVIFVLSIICNLFIEMPFIKFARHIC